MSAKRSLLLGLTIVSSWLLAACSSPKDIEVGGTCVLNSDCNSPLLCTNSKCHDACHASIDCPTGQNCVKVNGITVCELPEEAGCSSPAATCPASLVCASDKRCRTPCQSSTDCASAQQCVGGVQGGVCADPSELVDGQLPGAITDAGTDGKVAATGGSGGGSGGAGGSSGGGGDAAVAGSGGSQDAATASGGTGASDAAGSGGTAGSSGSGGAGGTGGGIRDAGSTDSRAASPLTPPPRIVRLLTAHGEVPLKRGFWRLVAVVEPPAWMAVAGRTVQAAAGEAAGLAAQVVWSDAGIVCPAVDSAPKDGDSCATE